MYNPNAVHNIVSAHLSKFNHNSNFFLKVALYFAAVVAFVVLNSHNYPAVGWGVMLGIGLLTLIFLGLPVWVTWDENQGDLVPDDVYVAIKSSNTIEPGLMNAIRYSLSPELKIGELVQLEKKYHEDKRITSRPGYRGLEPVEPDEPETN